MPSCSAPRPQLPLSDGDAPCLSAPLYELVDCILQLRSRGWVRRQVMAMARQVLSLVAGGAIDGILARAAARLTTPASIAGAIDHLRGSLWPGGVFYAHTPAAIAAAALRRQAAQEALVQAHQRAGLTGGAAGVGHGGGGDLAPVAGTQQEPPRLEPLQQAPPPLLQVAAPQGRVLAPCLSAERYLEPAPLLPEEAHHAEGVRRRMLSLPVPGPLLALLGRGAWFRCLHELYDLLQCPTAVLQLGHAVLEAALLALFPELEGTVQQQRVAAAKRGAAAQR
jgi:sorting nexin-13